MSALLSSLDWSDWIYGLFAGSIAGGASAVVSCVTVALNDPKDYGVGSGKFLTLFATVFITNAVMSMFLYLKQNPVPKVKTVTTIEKVELQQNPPAKVTTVVQQTKISDQPKEK